MAYRALVGSAFRRQRYSKGSKTHELLGCDFETFVGWIVSQWEPWMGWHNYGVQKKNGPRMWHVDHIIPVSLFDLRDEAQARKAFHYKNCRPLCAVQNISEGNRRKLIALP